MDLYTCANIQCSTAQRNISDMNVPMVIVSFGTF